MSAIDDMMAQFQISDEERRKIMIQNALLGLGAGLLDSRGKNVWPSISTGLLGGMQMGQQAIGNAQQGMVAQYKLKREVEQDRERKAMADAAAGLNQELGDILDRVKTDPAKAFQIYTEGANRALRANDMKRAEQLFKEAEKYRAKYSATPHTVMGPDGKPVLMQTSEYDPPRVIEGFAPKPEIELRDMGGSVQAVDKLRTPAGSEFAKSLTPESVLSAQVAREGHGVTMRGQNMTDARAREATGVAAGKGLAEAVTGIRKEYNGLEQVKAYRAALPALQSAAQAPDTPAGDIDLIYAVGKTLDPNSVVREGELNLVIKSGSPLQKFQGYVNYISQGRGRLPPAQRRELVSMLQGRAAQLKSAHDAAAAPFVKQAQSMGLPLDQVFQQDEPAPQGGNLSPAEQRELDELRKRFKR